MLRSRPAKFALPSVVMPSAKVTVPVGVPAPGALAEIVAVKVTELPKTDGFALLETAVVVTSLLTTCASVEDVLPAKFVADP